MARSGAAATGLARGVVERGVCAARCDGTDDDGNAGDRSASIVAAAEADRLWEEYHWVRQVRRGGAEGEAHLET